MYHQTINERYAKVDWLMILALLGLMVIGAAFVHSARHATESLLDLPWFKQLSSRQIIWYVVGAGAMFALTLVDYQILARWSLVVYWGCILTLLLVLVPFIGASRYGARRWIDLQVFQFQPSEFAKLAFILAMAHYLSRPPDELKQPRVLAKALGLLALPFLLIFLEPDLGSALVLLPVGLVMLFLSGASRKFLTVLVVGSAGIVALFLVDILFAPPNWRMKLEGYQRDRLLVYFHRNFRDYAPPDATPADLKRLDEQQRAAAYNINQALISVGSGGLTGKGWMQGQQTALGYLPRGVAHNDFIFSVIAEESGFVGSVVVITLYAVVLFTGIRIAGQARDRLGKLLAAGVVTLLFSHVIINIGMNIRLMPVTGVPLPLLSYGGSSVLCSLVAAGLLQNVYLHRRSY